jgi:hypothetical protein
VRRDAGASVIGIPVRREGGAPALRALTITQR